MIVTYYDRNFISLSDSSSLNVESYTIKRQAVDFDDFTFTSESFTADFNPTFVTLKDNRGRYKYGAFAGIPEIDSDNKTNCQCSDLKTLFNNDVLLQFSSYTYLTDMLSYGFTQFANQVVQSSFELEIDMTDISDIELGDLVPSTELSVYSFWSDVLVPYMKYYDCYMESKLDVANKKIIYYIKKINKKVLPLKVWELGLKNIGKWVASTNEAQAVVSVSGSLTYGDKYILLSDNTITTDENLRDLYPIKRKVVLSETDDATELSDLLQDANVEALTELVNARYNESIQISTNKLPYLEDIDFGTSFSVYTERGVFYKQLPLGIIEENETEEKILTIGYKADDIVFYI